MTKIIANPYLAGPPVPENRFHDRTDLLNQVRDELSYSNAILLQGQRRIGKTSFLHKLKSILMKEGAPGDFLPFYFDMQNCVDNTLPEFQEHIAGEIGKSLRLPVPSLTEFESDPDLFCKKWLPQVFEHLENRELVFLVDEFDNLGEKKESEALATLVPFVCDLIEKEHRLKWIFTVGRHMDKLPMDYERIVTRAEKHPIGRLSEDETRRLICEPAAGKLKFEPAAVERIFQLTSGQPSLTQALCCEVFGRVSDKERTVATKEDVDAAIADILKTYETLISSIAHVPLYEECILRAVAQLTSNGQAASKDDIIHLLDDHNISFEIGELGSILNRLVDWDLLEHEDQKWKPTMELVRIWVEKKVPLEPIQIRARRRLELAEQARSEGNYNLAIQDYREALKYIPQNRRSLRKKALHGLAEAYWGIGDFAGRIGALEKLYKLDPDVKPRLVGVLADYAQHCVREGKYWEAMEQCAAILKLQDRPRYKKWLVQSCLREADKHLEETKKPEVDKNYLLTQARRVVERGLTHVPVGPEAEQLERKLKEIDQREREIEREKWIEQRFEDARKAEEEENWREVTKAYIDLLKKNVELNPRKKRTLQKAAWKSFYNENSLFYRVPLIKSPIWLKSMVGALAGLIETLLLINLVPQIATWDAPLYALLIALNIGLVKAIGRQRAVTTLATHFIAGSAVAGLFWVITHIVGFELFYPSHFLAYVALIVLVAAPLASIVHLEMSFTYGKARTGIINGMFTLIGGTICALFGGVLGTWLVNSGVLELPLAAGVGLGAGWILVSLIMEIGDPATYSVSPDDIPSVSRR